MIDVKHFIDQKGLEVFMKKNSRQIPFAMSRAMNDVAFATTKEWGNEARRVFNNPVRLTLKPGFVFNKASKKKLRATYGLKDFMSKGTAPDRYLLPQVQGGPRFDKRSEKQLKMRGLLAPTDQLVPLDPILNSHGNVTKGKMTKILSDLQSFNESGFKMNATQNKKYFAVTRYGDRGKLKPGIYERMGRSKIRPVILFLKAPLNYKKRYDYYGVAERISAQQLPKRFHLRMLQASTS